MMVLTMIVIVMLVVVMVIVNDYGDNGNGGAYDKDDRDCGDGNDDSGGDSVCGDGSDSSGGDRDGTDGGGGGDNVCGDGSNDDDYILFSFNLLRTLSFKLIIHHAYIYVDEEVNFMNEADWYVIFLMLHNKLAQM